MTALPCSHGMPNAATCVDCMEEGPVSSPATWEPVGEWFQSQYQGECTCGRTIAPRSMLQRWDRSDGSRTVYTHARCTP